MSAKCLRIAAAALGGLLWVSGAAAQHSVGPFSYGADLRLRQIFIGNVGLDENSPIADRTFERYRTRIWGKYSPNKHLDVAARLIWEGRHYALPPESAYPLPGFETWYSGGVLFDNLYVGLNDLSDSGFSLKLGRQDIILGNGWLVLDGTPLDGSRTIYFDAARATYEADAIGTTFDAIYIDQYPSTDRFPKPLNGVIEDQTEQYETGAILYARNKSLLKDTELDGFFIYKGNDPNRTYLNIRVNNGAPFPSPSDNGEVYALGARVDSKLTPSWGLRAEAAGEWGTALGNDLRAFGFNGRLKYAFNDRLANWLHMDFEYLSGDDPDTRTKEAFDILWGRWPQWSELYIYQWPLDSRVGQATNLSRLNVGWGMTPHETTSVTVDYHALWANQQSVRDPSQLANISQDGNFRGHLFTAWVKTKLSEHISGHLVAEYLIPGNFYAANRQDNSYFVRAQLNLTW
jgi:hypothetical protein